MYSRTIRMRSKLFVPGSRPELFAKALASKADAISLDLEDSVPESRKAEARALVATFQRSAELRGSSKMIIVRVNAPGTAHFEADLLAVTQPGLALINLPKCESADQVRAAVTVLERAEAANGVTKPVPILANIETPRGLRLAAEIAGAHSRVAGLQIGYLDLMEPLGVDRNDAANVHAVMFAVRMAAAEAGVLAYDGAFADVKDTQGFRTEAEMARRLGFVGKSCIHPSQVAAANEVFQPTREEFAWAQRIVEASRKASAAGSAVFML
ncbi:MAG: citryl-CoA lyase, partial [Steroidobacteraceae bacterium]|nr:citryl-CoA lyase [Steroidobacteraceae bacterium]